ncbi:MAG: cyclopropane fatty acyl phospholipid synthase [Candidatus Hydrogenedentota bacterium]
METLVRKSVQIASPALQRKAEELLAPAGIALNGNHPWDVHIHHPRTYNRVFAQASLGLGESYMDGWWDCDQLGEFFRRLFVSRIDERVSIKDIRLLAHMAGAQLWNLQRKARAYQVGEQHYDLGNDLYAAMLDPGLNYSCAYWEHADNLDAAQEAKLDLVCRKLCLEPGMHVLDIGCGWGSFAKYAAERYGVRVTGATVSRQQADYATQWCRGLPIEIQLADYRDLDDRFDRVLSIGMFEHVGHKNYSTYFATTRRLLKEDGLAFVHTIGRNTTLRYAGTDPWITKYIFRNGELPSMAQITKHSEKYFVMEDWHNIGPNYAPTLMAWQRNFHAAWPRLKEKYGERFRRMWDYYLLMCAALFRTRKMQVWQIVFSPAGLHGGYTPVR